ncbi:putative glutaredoxin-like, plant II, Thioredoxin-like superfamily [Helianthus anomalus]
MIYMVLKRQTKQLLVVMLDGIRIFFPTCQKTPKIVYARCGCCMSHVVKRLLNGDGVNPNVFELEEDQENDVAKDLELIGAEHDGAMYVSSIHIIGFNYISVPLRIDLEF